MLILIAESELLPQKKQDDQIRIYEIYRRRVVEEDQLINHRMMWLLLSEPLFFTAFAITAEDLAGRPAMPVIATQIFFEVMVLLILCLGGIFLAVVSWISVNAARNEIKTMKAEYKKEMNYHGNEDDIEMNGIGGSVKILTRLTGTRKHHAYGHLAPIVIPPFFIGIWTFVTPYLIAKYWETLPWHN